MLDQAHYTKNTYKLFREFIQLLVGVKDFSMKKKKNKSLVGRTYNNVDPHTDRRSSDSSPTTSSEWLFSFFHIPMLRPVNVSSMIFLMSARSGSILIQLRVAFLVVVVYRVIMVVCSY